MAGVVVQQRLLLLPLLSLAACCVTVCVAKPVVAGPYARGNASATPETQQQQLPPPPAWRWGADWRTPPVGHRFAAPPLIMDLNSDGEDEFVLASFDGVLSVVSARDGRPAGGEAGGAWPRFHHGEAHFAAPVRFDVDLDGEEELVFVSYAGNLHFYSQDGQLKHEDRLPVARVPSAWLAEGRSTGGRGGGAQLLDSPAVAKDAGAVPPIPVALGDEVLVAAAAGQGQHESLRPAVFHSPILCDCDDDGAREELALGVTFLGERRLLTALLIYSLRLRRPRLWHWLEHSWLDSPHPAYLFSSPLWARLSPEQSHSSLVTASASGRLFAHRLDGGKPGRLLRSLQGFPVALGPLLHPPLLLSCIHGDSAAAAFSSSARQQPASPPPAVVIVVADATAAGVVSAVDSRGQLVWSWSSHRRHGRPAVSLQTPPTPLHLLPGGGGGGAFAAFLVVDGGDGGGDVSDVSPELLLLSAATGEARRLQLRGDDVALLDGLRQRRRHSAVAPMSRLLTLTCDSSARRRLLLAGVDSRGRLAVFTIDDAGEAAVSLTPANASTALGLVGVNSDRNGLADVVLLSTEGEVVKLASGLTDANTGKQCDLRVQESLSIRIMGAPYIEQSGSTIIVPILIDDWLNAKGPLSAVVYTVEVYIYNNLSLTFRYSQPGPHVMYFDAGSRPLKTQLLLRLSSSADGRSAETQATLVANVNYVYELPYLLYVPAGVTMLLLLGQLFAAEDSRLVLPFVARHTE